MFSKAMPPRGKIRWAARAGTSARGVKQNVAKGKEGEEPVGGPEKTGSGVSRNAEERPSREKQFRDRNKDTGISAN